MKTNNLNFFFLRLPLAISLAGHGLVRLPKLQTFSDWMVGSMANSALPNAIVLPFSYILPVLEAVVGIALLIGFKARYTIYAALTLMAILILGSASIENWGAIEAQLIHGIYLAFLLWWYESRHNPVVEP
jgi:thiosulfate dehydrogenase (quinone) large subunit